MKKSSTPSVPGCARRHDDPKRRRMMKALLSTATGGPETLTLGELPRPSAGKRQIVIDVKACAVNFPDVLIIEDKYQCRPERPFAPGGEVAELVAEVGEGVTDFKVGDRVIVGCGNGGISEAVRSEEHTSELQSLMRISYAVFRLKKKNQK